jgi:Spherulation-specific family 4
VTAAGGIAARVITEPGRYCQQALIPAYFYPGAEWTRAIESKPPPRLMILDVTRSGAGSSPDLNYQAAVGRARAAGITIAGYSDTDYTQRPAAAVESDVAHYKSWYGVTDIFLDGVSTGNGALAYYRRLSDYIHTANPGSLVILNPGTYPDQSYMSMGDIVLAFEGDYREYVRLSVPRWVVDYPAGRFAYVIYGVTGSQLRNAIGTARRSHAGYVYVTPDTGPNPYDSLPSYWTTEEAIIAACAGLPVGLCRRVDRVGRGGHPHDREVGRGQQGAGGAEVAVCRVVADLLEVLERGAVDRGVRRRHRPLEGGQSVAGQLRTGASRRDVIARALVGADLPHVSIHGAKQLATGAGHPFGSAGHGGLRRLLENRLPGAGGLPAPAAGRDIAAQGSPGALAGPAGARSAATRTAGPRGGECNDADRHGDACHQGGEQRRCPRGARLAGARVAGARQSLPRGSH